MAHILRRDEVEIEGHYDLGSSRPASDAAAGALVDNVNQVRIVENCPQYTIIEIMCSCGKASYIRCEH